MIDRQRVLYTKYLPEQSTLPSTVATLTVFRGSSLFPIIQKSRIQAFRRIKLAKKTARSYFLASILRRTSTSLNRTLIRALIIEIFNFDN